MRKIIIHPAYEHLRPFVENIPATFPSGTLVQQGNRNTLRLFHSGGTALVVKQFGRPNPLNAIVYSLFRKPKGLRAYTYADVLTARGFETPAPVAYIEDRCLGLVERSWFVSLQCPYARRFYEFGDADASQCGDIIRAFARFTARLHEAGILHRDYSPGNILFDLVDGEYRFSIVDINRMRFGSVSVDEGCRNFARLWGQIDFFRILADEYAAARGADAAQCFDTIRRARAKFWKRFAKRHRVKYRLEL